EEHGSAADRGRRGRYGSPRDGVTDAAGLAAVSAQADELLVARRVGGGAEHTIPQPAVPQLATPIERRLTRQLRRAEVVSFDVFDTAILRALADPADLFVLMEGTVGRALRTAFPDFAAARRHSEMVARERAWLSRQNREVTLQEIYAVLGEVVGLDVD